MELPELFQSMITKSGAQTVFGDPVSAEGKTIIPVARVSYGFGLGSGKRQTEQPEEGGGGGGGFSAAPVGVIEVSAGESRFVPIADRRRLAAAAFLGFMLGAILARRPRRIRIEKAK